MFEDDKRHSFAYIELINLRNIAKHHKEICNDPNCGISLYTLRNTAQRLVKAVWSNEIQGAWHIIRSNEFN